MDAAGLPPQVFLRLHKVRDLRYGENPHQPAAWYRGGHDAVGLRVTQGKELSFTNLLDLDSAARIAAEFVEPAAVVIKHTNPCGAATGATLADGLRAGARGRSARGVRRHRRLEPATSTPRRRASVVATFIEAVVAPGVSEEAAAILAGKKNMRVVIADLALLLSSDAFGRFDLRSILGGVLVQERDRVVEATRAWPPAGTSAGEGGASGLGVVTRRQPTEREWQALRFAWRVCAHVKSNAVIFTAEDRTLAVGAGQMSRVDAVKVAMLKAAERADRALPVSGPLLAGSVAASDAFFPFRDGLDAVAEAGATAVVQPGGSVRDAEVIAAADEHGLAMVFTGRRHFRH